MKILFDGDILAFKAACVSETREIKVTHLKTGSTKIFKNREEFYYRKNKIGGYLGEINKDRKVPFEIEDFNIEDVQNGVPEQECLRTLDAMINNMLKEMNYCEFTDTYTGFVGTSNTFRHTLATLMPYKGNRSLLKPLHLNACKKHMILKHGFVQSEGIEADDDIAIEQVQGYIRWNETKDEDDKIVAVTTDKDAKAYPGWLYNPDKDDAPKLIEGFGKLFLNKKKEVDGEGRLWSYYQIIAGDPVDNYALSCFSDITYGSKSAYKDLKGCKDDKEALQRVVDVAKMLYPEPKTITNWKGDTFEIDWFYVLNEQVQLALMLPDRDYRYDLKEILDRYKVKY